MSTNTELMIIVTLIFGDSEQEWRYWIIQDSMRLRIEEGSDTLNMYFERFEFSEVFL